MKDILNRYKNMKNEKRKILLLISIFIITISFTYAYFAPLIDEGATTNLNTLTGLTDNLYFESGNTLSITADQFNFAEGKGNISDTTTASAYLRANTGNETATEHYAIYLNVTKNEYVHTSIYYPELILNIYDPEGNEITELYSMEYTSYCGNDCVEGYDITELQGKLKLFAKYDIESNSSSEYTIQDWKFKITFINGDWDQSENTGKSFEAEIIMEHIEPLAPIMAIYSEDDTSLRFYNYDETAVVDELYNGLTVSEIYTDLEYSNFYVYEETGDYFPNTPWNSDATKIIVEEEIKPENTRAWFAGLSSIESIDISKLDTSEVTDMSMMFYALGEIVETFENVFIGLENLDTSKVKTMASMFERTGELSSTFSLEIPSTWDMSKVEDMSEMFSKTGKDATTVNITLPENIDTTLLKNMKRMFYAIGYRVSNATINDIITNLDCIDTTNVTNMFGVFDESGFYSTEFELTIPTTWNTSQVTNMSYMFAYAGAGASSFIINNISILNTSRVTDISGMFAGIGRHVVNWNLQELVPEIEKLDISNAKDISGFFRYSGEFSETVSLELPNTWNTSNVTDMTEMFENVGEEATKVSITNLSVLNTSKVTYMTSMFSHAGYEATEFIISDIQNWDTSNVENMSEMFYNTGYNATYTLDLSGWKVPLVTSYRNFNTGVESKVTAPTWVS